MPASSAPPPAERLTALVLFLLRVKEPHTLNQIAEETGLYDITHREAARKMFRRDRNDLRGIGVVITEYVVTKETGNDPGSRGYAIDPNDIVVRDPPDLTQAEKVALRLADRHIITTEHSDATGVAKLTAGVSVDDGLGPQVRLELGKTLPLVARAVYERRQLTFGYDGKPKRTVEPVAIKRQAGHDYFFALDGDTIKTFRTDRVDDTANSAPKLGDTFERTSAHEVDVDAKLPQHPWEFAFGDDYAAKLVVDAARSDMARERLGASATSDEVLPDGSVALGFRVQNANALRDWLTELGAGAVITEPPALVDNVVAWLSELVDIRWPDVARPDVNASCPETPPVAASASQSIEQSGRSGSDTAPESTKPLSITEQVALLLAIVPWAFATGQERIPLADISREFGVPVKALYDLLYPAMAWEVRDPSTDDFAHPGFTVASDDDYEQPADSEHFNKDLAGPGDGTRVYLRLDASSPISKPFDLGGMEVLSTLMVGHLALELPGVGRDGALGSAVAKLEQAFGNRLRFSIDAASTPWHTELQDAITNQQVLEVRYWESSSDTEVTLTVEPLVLHRRWGHWYVVVRTRSSSGDTSGGTESDTSGVRVRPLRLQRIEELNATTDTFAEPPAEGDVERAFSDFSGGAAVTLRHPKADARRIDKYPAASLDVTDGTAGADATVTATYHLRSPLIFARMMLQLAKPDSLVNAHELPAEFLAAPSELAREMLARYDADGT